MIANPITFGDWADSEILSNIDGISRFRLVTNIPRISQWSDQEKKYLLADTVYDYLSDVIKAAKFFYQNELSATVGQDRVVINYADDRFSFSVIIEQDALAIERRGSSLESFFDWYVALMPSAHGVITTTLDAIKTIFGRGIGLTRSDYSFDFILHKLSSTDDKQPVKNTKIMSKLFKGFPDDSGGLSTDLNALESMARTDFNVQRWVGKENERRILRFKVEAPANLEWSTLWLNFGYGIMSYTSPTDSTRHEYKPDKVLSEYDDVLKHLKDTAINGFLMSLMDGFSFESISSDNLP